MTSVKVWTATSCLSLVIFSALFIYPALGYSENEAKTAVETAENKVLSCYNAAYEAEKTGANISELLNTLNDAGWLLAKAKLAYSQGDFNSSVTLANECQSKLEGFIDQAEDLRQSAEKASYVDFMVNFVGSGISTMCIIIGSFALWAFLRKREEVREKV